MESLIGNRIGSLYITSQRDNKVYCYCSNCRNNNAELSYTRAKYYISHNKNITCGCSVKQESEESKERLIGTRYNELTIIKQKDFETVECRCKCGKLLETTIFDLEENNICMCDECKIEYDRNKKCSNYLLTYRYYKELYYIWTSFKNLYNSPTEDFEKKILKNNIEFFPELDNKENAFDLFYQWATVGCEQKYGEDGKVALIRIDPLKDYSGDNCTWIFQDLDKDNFVKLGNNNIDEEISYYNDSVYHIQRLIDICQDCLYTPKYDKNKTDEENKKNYDRCTQIYAEIIINNDVKNKLTKGYFPYIYENKCYHKECLLQHLRNNIQDETEVQKIYQDIIKEHNTDNRKAGKLTAKDVENARVNRVDRKKLIQYLLGKYNVKQIDKLLMYQIDNLNKGNTGEMGIFEISYSKLLDMFLYYDDFLQEHHKKFIGKDLKSKQQFLAWDLAILISKFDEYNNREVARYTQQAQQDERGEILDVKKYRLDLQNRNKQNNEKEIDESIKRAIEFAKEYTKEYEEDKYNYGIFNGIFDDEKKEE